MQIALVKLQNGGDNHPRGAKLQLKFLGFHPAKTMINRISQNLELIGC